MAYSKLDYEYRKSLHKAELWARQVKRREKKEAEEHAKAMRAYSRRYHKIMDKEYVVYVRGRGQLTSVIAPYKKEGIEKVARKLGIPKSHIKLKLRR